MLKPQVTLLVACKQCTMASSEDFPCHLSVKAQNARVEGVFSVIDTICRSLNIPFPSARHAAIALRSLSVDKELSPLVKRHFSVKAPVPEQHADVGTTAATNGTSVDRETKTVLEVLYSATTPRMLRVAVNGFFESLGVVLGVMEELDEDVLGLPGKESVAGAQGLEPLDRER